MPTATYPKLFKALKGTYEPLGASAEYYVWQTYDHAKISDYDSLEDFIMALMNLVHLVNKEVQGTNGQIQEWHITMQIIYSLPPTMHTLQTTLLKKAPLSTNANWDPPALKLQVVSDKHCAWAAGENLRTKLDMSWTSNTLAAESSSWNPKQRDLNNPTWLSWQMCWWCGKLGHIHQKCTASQAEKDAYQSAKEKGNANVGTTPVETNEYARAMVVEEVIAPQIALSTTTSNPKPWAINSGCTSHFNPNISQFVSYTPFTTQCHVHLGNSSLTPSLGEGTVHLTCMVNGKPVIHFIHNVQYVPGLAYGLLSCKVLLQQGLKVILKDDTCKIYHRDGNLVAESDPNPGWLFFLHTPCYIHGKLHIYMYLYLVSSMLQLVQSFPLMGFWCWPSFGEWNGPVGSIDVNQHLPGYLFWSINKYTHLSLSELLYTVLLSLLSLTSIRY